MLHLNEAQGKGSVELFERGYGKDAAGIAKEAISYGMEATQYPHGLLIDWNMRTAKDHDFDVVLIDTAGRMQDNEVEVLLSI